ncbi:MAG: PaaR repeat-containing protein [Gemmataceae bacterium]
MPPAARVLIESATAPETCPITGPGCPTVLVCGEPISCEGDAVAGVIGPNEYAGTVTMGSTRVEVGGKPATYVGSVTTGVLTPPPPTPPVPETPGAIVAGTPPCTVEVGV